MSYFEQILGGNIPLSVIESVEGFQNEVRMATRFPHVQIKGAGKNRPYPGVLAMLASDYANHVNMSIALKRDDLVRGVRALLTTATNEALARNKNDIIKLGDMDASKLSEADKAMTKKVTAQVSADLSKSLMKAVEGLNFPSENKDILVNIMHLTGLTNKSSKDLVDITKKLGLLLELHPSFTPDIMINIIESLNNKLNPAAIKKCKDKLVLDCLFDDEFINSMAENTIDVLDNILGNMMRATKHGRICKFYTLSVEISRAISLSPSPSPKVEKFADESCADESCAYGSYPEVEETFANDSCAGPSHVEHFTSSGFGFIDRYSHLFGARALEREDFAVDIGNTKNIKNKKSMQDLSESEKKLDQSKVIEGAATFVTKAVNKAASSNKADLMKTLAASNRLNIGSAKSSDGGFKLTNISQLSKIESKTDANFVQKIANKITTDIANNMKDEVKTSTKQIAETIDKKKEDTKAATNVGDAVVGVVGTLAGAAGGAVGKIADAAASIYSASIGNSTTEDKSEDTLKSVKEKYSLDQSFKQKNKKDVSNDFANALSSENLAKCANDAAASNNMDIGKVDVKGDIILDGIKQESLVNDVMNCAFNQEVTNEIATKLVSNFDSLIQEMIENVDKKLSDAEIAKIQGDIYAAGIAGAAILQGAGEAASTAAQGAGKGVASAAEGAGKGIESAAKGAAVAAEGVGKGLESAGKGAAAAAEGVGKGAAAVASSLTGPLIAAAVLAAIALVGYILYKKKGSVDALTSGVGAVALPAAIAQKGGLDLLEFVNQLSDTPVFRK
jgi:hypothetical protein